MSVPAELEYQKVLSEVKKLNEETRKFVAEAENYRKSSHLLDKEEKKVIEETENYRKRNQFFIATFVLGVFAAGIAFAKLFI